MWGSPPEGVALSLWALPGNVSREALIPCPAWPQSPHHLQKHGRAVTSLALSVLYPCSPQLANLLLFHPDSRVTFSRKPSPTSSNYVSHGKFILSVYSLVHLQMGIPFHTVVAPGLSPKQGSGSEFNTCL